MLKSYNVTQYAASHKKRTEVSSLLIFILMPVTIFCGYEFFDDRKYMVISLILLIYTMVPFFMIFESRKPKAREIVLIAMMASITVCAQMFFHITIPIQAGTALVIISGISLGPEAGFLVGALSRFVCNFYMGQGPWTPWEMFCWGLLGFIAGIVFNKVELDNIKSRNFKVILGPIVAIIVAIIIAYTCYILWPGGDTSFFGWRLYVFGIIGLIAGALVQRKRLPVDGITLTVFTFFIVFIVYGGIMNICAMITSAAMPDGSKISMETLKLLYISGIPYDGAHAGTAALCMFLFGDSIIKKIERVKIKYGIYR